MQYGTKLQTAHTAPAAAFLLHHAKNGTGAINRFGICSGAVNNKFFIFRNTGTTQRTQGEDGKLFVGLSQDGGRADSLKASALHLSNDKIHLARRFPIWLDPLKIKFKFMKHVIGFSTTKKKLHNLSTHPDF